MSTPRTIGFACAFGVACLLDACATSAPSRSFEMNVRMAPAIGEERVTVAIVLVSDALLAQRLLDVSSGQWFEMRRELRRAPLPAFSEVVCVLGPDSEQRTISVTLGADPAAAFVFILGDGGSTRSIPVDVRAPIQLALVGGAVEVRQ